MKLKTHVERTHDENYKPIEPIGDLKIVAGIRQNIPNSKVFSHAQTCDINVKSAKRKYAAIEIATGTINSPSKRPNSEFYKTRKIFCWISIKFK